MSTASPANSASTSSTHPTDPQPPQPPAGSTKPKRVITRSRDGCLVCRQRRVRCDKGHPTCARCVKYGAECMYPAKKVFKLDPKHMSIAGPPGSSSSGHLSIQAEPLQPPSPGLSTISPHTDGPSVPLNTAAHSNSHQLSSAARRLDGIPAIKAMDPMDVLLAMCRTTRMGSFFTGPLDPPAFLSEMFPNEDDLRCFHHCLTYTLSICVAEEDQNPWITDVTTWFLFPDGTAPLSTTALKQSMLTLGASHLAYLHAKSGNIALSAKFRALQQQRRRETDETLQRAQAVHEEIMNEKFLAACVATHVADVHSAHPTWRQLARLSDKAVKLRGGWENILYGPDSVPPSRGLWAVFAKHILFMEATSMTTGTFWSPFKNDAEGWARLEADDPAYGNSAVFDEVTGIHRSMLHRLFSTMSLCTRVRALQSGPASMSLASLPAFSPHQTFEPAIIALEHDLALWPNVEALLPMTPRVRAGSLLYLYACQILVRRELRGAGKDDAEVQVFAGKVLDMCGEVGEKVELINWPLLIAAVQLIDPEKRELARSHLKTFTYQCCCEIEVIQMVIEESWQRSDRGEDDASCGWREILYELGCSANLGS
ncbi:hypothetical protein IAT38_003029 [Cryptococcus sp. DSM 104549]